MEQQPSASDGKPNFSGGDLSQELERQVEVDRLSKDLLLDFYQTFRLSQGETAVQPPLFTLLAQQHRLAGHQDMMPFALQEAGSRVRRLMPPTRHQHITSAARDDRETGFQAMWDEYSNTLKEPDVTQTRPTALILDDILVQEEKYQDQERPNRSDSDDPHESILREYIILDRLTGSDQLKAVRDHLREIILSPPMDGDGEWMAQRLHSVIEKWEDNHPGQPFMPSTEVEETVQNQAR